MVRIAVLGDVHIRLPKNQDSVEYIEDISRYNSMFDYVENCKYDLVIFAGDLFDKARPSLEEIKYVCDRLARLPSSIIIDGNHEAVTKTSSTYDYIHIPNTTIMNYDVLTIENTSIRFMGYKHLANHIIVPKSDILISHFRSNVGAFIKEEVPVKEIAKRFKDVILGDIHSMYNPEPNVWYTSSPYGLHYSKSKEKYGYIELVIDSDKYTIDRVELNLPRKIKIEANYDDVIKLVNDSLVDRYLIEVEGTLDELSNLPKHRLVKYITKLANNEVEVDNVKLKRANVLDTLELLIPESTTTNVLSTIYKEVS